MPPSRRRLTGQRWRANVNCNMLRLLTFGGFEIESGDSSVAPRLTGRDFPVLAVLAAVGDRGYRARERLLSLFWPDSDDDLARSRRRQ
jgi:DNA-binding SARP family transcriptional activator